MRTDIYEWGRAVEGHALQCRLDCRPSQKLLIMGVLLTAACQASVGFWWASGLLHDASPQQCSPNPKFWPGQFLSMPQNG